MMDIKVEINLKEEEPFCSVELLEEKRRPLEAEVKPVGIKNLYQTVIETRRKELEAEIELFRKNQVAEGLRNSARHISDQTEEGQKLIIEFVRKSFSIAVPKLIPLREELDSLSAWSHSLDSEFNAFQLSEWLNRCKALDAEIATAKARCLEPFHRGMINTERVTIGEREVLRFPADRVGQLDDKYFDLYLMELLKTKERLYFDPFQKYRTYRKRAYIEISLPTYQAALDAERKARTAS